MRIEIVGSDYVWHPVRISFDKKFKVIFYDIYDLRINKKEVKSVYSLDLIDKSQQGQCGAIILVIIYNEYMQFGVAGIYVLCAKLHVVNGIKLASLVGTRLC